MRTHTTWSALLDPGGATSFFGNWGASRLRPDPGFHPLLGLWMAELSRLCYRPHPREGVRSRPPSPAMVLEPVGLRETLFANSGGTQCLGVEARDASSPFAILVFRGTSEPRDFLVDICFRPVEWDAGRVHDGFSAALSEVWSDLQAWLTRLECPFFITGHSLGAALASLAAVRSPVAPRAVYTFGSPRVGDLNFARAAEARAPLFRVVNDMDVVATTPGFQPFVHAGTPIRIDSRGGLEIGGPRETEHGWPRRTHPRYSLLLRLALAAITRFLSFQGPPRELADHAPANYVAGLQTAAFPDPWRTGPL